VVRVGLAFLLLTSVLVLAWMSFLRVNNLADDVKVLKEEVARLKAGTAPDVSAAEAAAPVPVASPSVAPAGAAPPPPPASPAGLPSIVEARTPGFLDEGRPEQFVAIPGGGMRAAEVTVIGIQGEGSSEVVLPDPIGMTLQPGAPHAVTGICQGPEDAAWVFTLEPGGIRVASRGCEYPVRGLRPRLRVRPIR
jgi:hypothetical protein